VERALCAVTMGPAITVRMLPDNINFHLFFYATCHVLGSEPGGFSVKHDFLVQLTL